MHLVTVAGKASLLFLGFNTVFLLETRRNRKIIAATMALLSVALIIRP